MMTRQISASQIGSYAADAIATAVGRHLPRALPLAAQGLKQALEAGNSRDVSRFVESFGALIAADHDVIDRLRVVLPELAAVCHGFQAETLSDQQLRQAVQVLQDSGDLCESLYSQDMSYNLYEVGYGIANMLDEPALGLATSLLATAQPAKTDQFSSAAWRFAAERLRSSIAARSEWIEALDAVELALTAPPADDLALRQTLYQTLERAVRSAMDTPIGAIVAVMLSQAPPGTVAEATREQLYKVFVSPTAELPSDGNVQNATAFMAAIKAQNMIDDLRVELGSPSTKRPRTNWHDLTLDHGRLTSAVPLGRSLIADIDRTGGFALELVHELGHAYCLLGPIGWIHTALRAANHYVEMILLDIASTPQDQNTTAPREPLQDLPTSEVALAAAQYQLEIALRARTFEAVWTPWLEGVAIYLELLCDPAQNQNEIIAPHSAFRSLIDTHITPHAGESADDFATRFADQSAQEFEEFYSTAVRRLSRLRHLAYATSPEVKVYLAGYLMVRAIVSRWELALGRRLDPMEAIKVLLDATRNGTSEAFADIGTPLERYQEDSVDRFMKWVCSLSTIDAPTLTEFLTPVESDHRGHRFSWVNGRPRRETQQFQEAATLEFAKRLKDAAARLALGMTKDADVAAPSAAVHVEMIGRLFDFYRDMFTLIPIGQDSARILLFDDTSRVAICPRTYAGLGEVIPDLALQRYSIGSWIAPGGAAEIRKIREECIRRRTGRVSVTRVLDMVGDPESPLPSPYASYVSTFLGRDWAHITVGYLGLRLDENEHKRFRDRIIERLNPLPFGTDETNTLASPAFLANRLTRAGVSTAAATQAGSADQRSVTEGAAYLACAHAFGVSSHEMRNAIEEACGDRTAIIGLFSSLHASGFPGTANRPNSGQHIAIDRMALDRSGFSGVKAFSEEEWLN
jgi:hypothetical protein